MEHSQYQLLNLWDQLRTPSGLAVILILVILLAVAATVKGSRWVILALLLYVSSMGSFRPDMPRNFITPIQQMCEFGRSICVGLMGVLLLPAILSGSGWRSRLVLGSTVLFFMFEMVFSTRILLGGDVFRGYFALVTFVLIFLTCGWGLSRWLQDFGDVRSALWSVVWAGILFAGASAIQLAVNPAQVVWNGRFQGTADNANHTAAILVTGLLPTIYFLASGRLGFRRRTLLGLACGVMVVMLAWTGSRTGAVMLLSGIAVLFRGNIKGLFMFVIIGGIFVVAVWQVLAPDVEGTSHLLSIANTRTGAWSSQIDQFMRSPVIGVPVEESSNSENSYLLAAAHTGLVGLVPLLLAIIFIGAGAVRLNHGRRRLGEEVALVDLVLAGIASLLVGGMFEAFLLGIYSMPVYDLYFNLALMAFLLDVTAHAHSQAPELQAYGFDTDTNSAY